MPTVNSDRRGCPGSVRLAGQGYTTGHGLAPGPPRRQVAGADLFRIPVKVRLGHEDVATLEVDDAIIGAKFHRRDDQHLQHLGQRQRGGAADDLEDIPRRRLLLECLLEVSRLCLQFVEEARVLPARFR